MYSHIRSRRAIRLSSCLLVAMVWVTSLSTAQALINPHYTPVDLYYQSPTILRVEIAGPDDQANMAVTVVKVLKGTLAEKLSLRADVTDEQLTKNLKAVLGDRKTVSALLFSGDFSSAVMDDGAAYDSGDSDTPLGMLQLGTQWFALTDGGGHLVLSSDPLDMHTVWAGSDAMLQRVMEYVATDVRADVPTTVGVAWGGQVKLAHINGTINGCMAVDVFDDGRPCLFVLAESGDRLFRSDDGRTFDDVGDEIELHTQSTHAVWGDFNAEGHLDLASCRGRRLSMRIMAEDGKLADGGDDVELPGECLGLSLFATADGKHAGWVAATAEVPVMVTTGDDGKMSLRACRIPTEAGEGRGGPCVTADFNGDAIIDILQPRDNGLLFFEGSASGTFSAATIACDFHLGDVPNVSMCGDYDADGLLDLLVAGKSGCRTFVNLGDGKFRDTLFEAGEVQYNATGADVVAGANCDINNDGRQDFMLFCADTWPRPFFNRGFRCFGFAVELDPQRSDLEAAQATKAGQQGGTIADFNDDGAQDMAVVTTDGAVWLLLRDADQGSRLGVTLWMAGDDQRPRTRTAGVEKPAPIARLVKADGCKWADGQIAMAEGGELKIGSVLELLDGVARIKYADGVQVSLEGPAMFELTSSEVGTLHTGQLSATVPKVAIGFTINTPTLKVVDLGTQFGVRVDDGRRTEVHVFQGEVETHTQGASAVPKESQLLTTTQAAQFDTRGMMVGWIEPDYDGFSGVERHAPGVLSTNRAVRWLPRPPASLEAGELQSNSSVFLLLERQNVLLGRDLEITSVQRKGTQAHFSTELNALPAGTRVDSYLLHFDPSLSPQSGSGEIHFERPILGIIARGDQLMASDDLLGIPDMKYERSDVPCRGLDDASEDRPPDVVNYLHSADRLQVTFGVQTGTLDQVRILVESE